MSFGIRAFTLILVTVGLCTKFRDTRDSDKSVLGHDETKRQEKVLLPLAPSGWSGCVFGQMLACVQPAAETMEPAPAAPGNLMTPTIWRVLGNTDNSFCLRTCLF